MSRVSALVLALTLSACGASTTPDTTACVAWTSGNPPVGCEIVVDGCCYQEAADACAAAGCPGDCMLLESYPAQVRCP